MYLEAFLDSYVYRCYNEINSILKVLLLHSKKIFTYICRQQFYNTWLNITTSV